MIKISSQNNVDIDMCVSPKKAPGLTMSTRIKALLQSVANSGNSSMRKRPRSGSKTATKVSFAIFPTVLPTLSLNEYSKDEIQACWYDENECASITKDCLKLIQKMASGKQLNARKHSFRGLEHYIEENIRELHKMEVYIAVLEEQNKQLAKGINDPKKIANAYRRTEGWKKYQKEALERGAQDYRIVCNVSAKAA